MCVHNHRIRRIKNSTGEIETVFGSGRPAGELGPIILCLDTSGSMAGPRETVAKATALECLRAATDYVQFATTMRLMRRRIMRVISCCHCSHAIDSWR